jgi:acetylornithine deacetylase
LLTGHTDVVGVEHMTIKPFVPHIEGGRLYGRGAYDMKGGLAAILGAVASLIKVGFQPRGDVYLGFVADEEYASLGTAALVKEIKPDAAILTEPTEMDICIAHRGFAWLTITTEGRAAHGSLYDVGIDAIRQMGSVLGILSTMEQDIFPRRSHALLGRASAHASLINGGLGLSTYPDRCVLQVEHRLLPDESAEQVLALWQTMLREVAAVDPDFKADVTLDFAQPGFEIDRNSPVVQTLDASYRQVIGRKPVYFGTKPWLDAALLSAAGIPTVVLGPGGTGAHAAVEYVELADVHRCAAVLAEAAVRWVGERT